MVRIDAAMRAKVMPGRERIELIELQMFTPLHYANSVQRHGRNNRASAPAHRTITAARIHHAIGKTELQHHRTTMARRFVPRLYLNSTYFLEH
jgi:hypothetical protein